MNMTPTMGSHTLPTTRRPGSSTATRGSMTNSMTWRQQNRLLHSHHRWLPILKTSLMRSSLSIRNPCSGWRQCDLRRSRPIWRPQWTNFSPRSSGRSIKFSTVWWLAWTKVTTSRNWNQFWATSVQVSVLTWRSDLSLGSRILRPPFRKASTRPWFSRRTTMSNWLSRWRLPLTTCTLPWMRDTSALTRSSSSSQIRFRAWVSGWTKSLTPVLRLTSEVAMDVSLRDRN